ncbi:MAG: hypothetical protein ACO3FE_17525 [Planctomycetaceae bacterium]
MASKKGNGKKHYPVVRGSKLGYTVVPAGTTYLIQADRHLSQLNRRLYRMGRYYNCKLELDVTSTADIEVFALRDDWAVQKAFQLGFAQYMKNTSDERNNMSSNMIARWSDFRVDPGTAGTVTDLVPVLSTTAGGEVQLTTGEFELAEVVDAAGSTRTFTWGTPGATEYGLLQEYDKTANTQNLPSNVSGDAPYVDIDSEVNEATHDHLEQDGNEPPYERIGVNSGSPFVKIARLGVGGTGAQKLSTGYFNAPCGLILITGMNAVDVATLNIEYKAGDYKGVHAPSMLE